MFINVRTKDSNVFLNVEEIQRISFSKSDEVKQSERITKIMFKDGTKGEYISHRSLEKDIKDLWTLRRIDESACSCNCESTQELVEA